MKKNKKKVLGLDFVIILKMRVADRCLTNMFVIYIFFATALFPSTSIKMAVNSNWHISCSKLHEKRNKGCLCKIRCVVFSYFFCLIHAFVF